MSVASSNQYRVDVHLQGAKVERKKEWKKQALLADERDEDWKECDSQWTRDVEKKRVCFGELIGGDECTEELWIMNNSIIIIIMNIIIWIIIISIIISILLQNLLFWLSRIPTVTWTEAVVSFSATQSKYHSHHNSVTSHCWLPLAAAIR